MFDITSSKLLLLGIVALLVIGPKDFPVLLRTIGKYVGIIRGHAKEFRAQFDEAMRESELDQLKKDVEKIAHETEASMSDAGRAVESSIDEARRTIDTSVPPDPLAHDANGLPIAQPTEPTIALPEPATSAEPSREPTPPTSGTPVAEGHEPPRQDRAPERSGA
jgi:sec-independent protein translocase protein TatB